MLSFQYSHQRVQQEMGYLVQKKKSQSSSTLTSGIEVMRQSQFCHGFINSMKVIHQHNIISSIQLPLFLIHPILQLPISQYPFIFCI